MLGRRRLVDHRKQRPTSPRGGRANGGRVPAGEQLVDAREREDPVRVHAEVTSEPSAR
jgi:hypothetical protein